MTITETTPTVEYPLLPDEAFSFALFQRDSALAHLGDCARTSARQLVAGSHPDGVELSFGFTFAGQEISILYVDVLRADGTSCLDIDGEGTDMGLSTNLAHALSAYLFAWHEATRPEHRDFTWTIGEQ